MEGEHRFFGFQGGVAQEQVATCTIRGGLGAAGNFREEWVSDITYDQTNGLRPSGHQTARHLVGPIIQPGSDLHHVLAGLRSEERRVGKECRSRWSPYH